MGENILSASQWQAQKEKEREQISVAEANSLKFDLRDSWGLEFSGPCRAGERISIWDCCGTLEAFGRDK